MAEEFPIAAEIEASEWINVVRAPSLKSLRGKVVAIHAFQMLCPGCVMYGIPQASEIHSCFAAEAFQMLGLHSVFEHHQVMTAAALKVFSQEYRLRFPIAVDQATEQGGIPRTMQKYQLRGTPSLLLIDKSGRLRLNHFGRIGDIELGAMIGRLLAEAAPDHAGLPRQDSSDGVAAALKTASGQLPQTQ